MALEIEGVVDGGVHAEKPLGGGSRLEQLHFALSPPHRLMRVFGTIISPRPLLMWASQSQAPECGGVKAQLIGDQQFGREALLPEQLAHQPQRRSTVAPTLNQHVEDLTFMVDVRLGWWLGNPGKEGVNTYTDDSPRRAALSFRKELFGLTTDDQPYVYLSDGGHFEKLGLYEMVRRRCRFILVSDAGCDPRFALEDLGNAVRKISLDLGVEIRFQGLEKLRPRPTDGTEIGADQPYHAVF